MVPSGSMAAEASEMVNSRLSILGWEMALDHRSTLLDHQMSRRLRSGLNEGYVSLDQKLVMLLLSQAFVLLAVWADAPSSSKTQSPSGQLNSI